MCNFWPFGFISPFIVDWVFPRKWFPNCPMPIQLPFAAVKRRFPETGQFTPKTVDCERQCFVRVVENFTTYRGRSRIRHQMTRLGNGSLPRYCSLCT